MAVKRTYEDGCAAAHALDLVGDRWALLIVRDLLLGPKRFTALRAGLPSISPNVLTQRLNDLESALVLRRRRLPPPASAWAYELTDWGRELEPVVLQLAHWGVRSPAFLRGAPLGVDALMLSFKSMFMPGRAQGRELSIELRFEHDVFAVMLRNGALQVERGAPPQPQAKVATDPQALLQLAYGKAPLEPFIESGRLHFTGQRQAIQAFLDLFALPALADEADRAANAATTTQSH